MFAIWHFCNCILPVFISTTLTVMSIQNPFFGVFIKNINFCYFTMLIFHHTKFSFHLQNSFFLSLRPECLWNIAKLWQMRHKKALLANHPHLASSIYTFLVQTFMFSKEIFTFLPLFSISYFCVFTNIWPFFFLIFTWYQMRDESHPAK